MRPFSFCFSVTAPFPRRGRCGVVLQPPASISLFKAGAAGTYASWPERVRAYAVATTPVNIRDWACAYGGDLPPELLSTIATPVSVAVGGASHPAICRANGLIATAVKDATFKAIGGAAHFMIATHPAQVAKLIMETVSLAGTRGWGRASTSQDAAPAAACCRL